MKKLSKQITLGTDPYTGKRIRKRITATSPAGLIQAEKEAIKKYAKGGIRSGITFNEYKDRWLEVYTGHLADVTQKTYKSILKHCDQIGGKKMCDIYRTDLQAIINQCIDHVIMCRRLASLLASIFRSAVFDGIVDKNIAEKLKIPKMTKSGRRAFTEEENKAIREVDLPEDERLLVDILYQFGLRPAEALALGKTSIDVKNRMLIINRSLTTKNGKAALKGTKTGVSRSLPIPDSMMPRLQRIRKLYFFTNEDGTLLNSAQRLVLSDRIIRKINAQMGGNRHLKVTDITLYSFRHNRATLLYYTDGISTKKKAQYMGHSEEMFLKTYSHLIEEKENEELLRQAVI